MLFFFLRLRSQQQEQRQTLFRSIHFHALGVEGGGKDGEGGGGEMIG